MEDEKFEKVNSIAKEILNLSRSNIFMKLRFLENAMSRVSLIPYNGTLSTDGVNILYNPYYVIAQYKKNKSSLIHDLLHLILHNMYIHFYVSPFIDRAMWDLACDICIENIIIDENLDFTNANNYYEKQTLIDKIKPHVPIMSAEFMMEYINSELIKDPFFIEKLMESFRCDDHTVWYMNMTNDPTSSVSLTQGGNGEESDEENDNNPSSEQRENNSNDEKNDDSNDENESNDSKDDSKSSTDNNDEEKDESQNNSGSNEKKSQDSQDSNDKSDKKSNSKGNSPTLTKSEIDEVRDKWKEISEQVKCDLETFNKQYGKDAGAFMQTLNELTRERYNYEEFLKKFSVTTEIMKINPDEFDLNYYYYGKSIYDDLEIALIEELEYKDQNVINEFVIAIDTSGSCSGDVVERFLNKTYSILMTNESFNKKVNIYIIQCDAAIQDVKRITSASEFEEYKNNFKLYGFGGTDFRPVFNYVDELINKGEINNLNGLIYFTDGYGEFPKSMPTYKTAFVFLEENREYNNYDVPVWAMKLILRDKEI